MENTNNNSLVVAQDVASVDLVEQLKNPNGQFYCSIKDDGSRKTKVAIFNEKKDIFDIFFDPTATLKY
jgi:hypothetical protein